MVTTDKMIRTIWITIALVLLMTLTRFNHFGSSVSLPDASYAVFFLGGLYLGRVRAALAILALLMFEASLIDFYAINFQGISSYCVTSAYSFLVFAYGSLWLGGKWMASYSDASISGFAKLILGSAVAGAVAFIIANMSFYLLAGYFDTMSIMEYISRVSQYFGSYVAITTMYVGIAISIQFISNIGIHINKNVN